MDSFPIGFASWLVAGITAFAVARMIPRRRGPYPRELGVALICSIAAGMAATALNFGGWQVLSPHGAGFAFAASLAAIPLARLAGSPSRSPHAVE